MHWNKCKTKDKRKNVQKKTYRASIVCVKPAYPANFSVLYHCEKYGNFT